MSLQLSSSSTTTGNSLNPIANSWLPKLPHMMIQPLPLPLPPQPQPLSPHATPFFYYYPTTTAPAGKLYNNNLYYFTFTTFPHYQIPFVKVGSMAEAPTLRSGTGYYAGESGHKKKKNAFRPTLPPRLLFKDEKKMNGGFKSNRNNVSTTVNVRKAKRNNSGQCKGVRGGGVVGVENKTKQLSSSFSTRVSAHGNTTVMIKNIPNKLRRDSLMNFLDGYCKDHHLEYDFIYLPIDFKWLDNLGYAFVNFTTSSAALMIMELLNNYKWGCVNLQTEDHKCYVQSKKICEVTWAKIQGKKELIRHFEESTFACHTVDFLPAEFDPPRNGVTTNTKPKVIGKLKPTGSGYPMHLVDQKYRRSKVP